MSRRETLLDFFEDFASSNDVFVVHDDGYRVRQVTYRELSESARGFAVRLDAQRIGRGDKVVIWSENRAEWLTAFWGCLLAGAIVVPVDYRASQDLLRRIARIVKAKLVLVGAEVARPADLDAPVWELKEAGPDTRSPGPSAGPPTRPRVGVRDPGSPGPEGPGLRRSALTGRRPRPVP